MEKVNPIADLIRDELEKQNKSQRELAEYLGVSEGGLWKMFKTDRYKHATMLKIAKFLNFDINFLNSRLNKSADGSTTQVNDLPNDPNALKQVIETQERIIEAKDAVISAKNDLIETLKEKLKR